MSAGRLPRQDLLRYAVWLLAAPPLLFPQRAVWLTALAAVAVLALFLDGRRRYGHAATALDRLLLLYLAFSAVAFLISPLPLLSLRRLSTLLLGVCGYYEAVRIVRNRSLQSLLTAAAPLGALIALGGFLLVEQPMRTVIPIPIVLPQLGGPLQLNNNELAGVLLLLFALALGARPTRQNRRLRSLWTVAIGLMLIVLLLMQSRNALLGLGLIALVHRFWPRLRTVHLLPLVLLWLLPLLALWAPPGISSALNDVDRQTKSDIENGASWLGRIEIWQAAAQMTIDYPVVGAGLYLFDPLSQMTYSFTALRPTATVSHAHNLLLQTASGSGIPAALTLLLLWLTCTVALMQHAGQVEPAERRLLAGPAAALAATLFFNSFDVLTLEQRAGLFVWLLLAICAGRADPQPPRTLSRLAAAPLLLLLLLLPALPANLSHRRLDRIRVAEADPRSLTLDDLRPADFRRRGLLLLAQGQTDAALQIWRGEPLSAHFLAYVGRKALIAGDSQAALTYYDVALLLDPHNGMSWYWQGDAYAQLGQPQQALVAYALAGEHVDEPLMIAETWAARGRIYTEQQAWRAAVDAFDRAVQLAPDQESYRRQWQQAQTMLDTP